MHRTLDPPSLDGQLSCTCSVFLGTIRCHCLVLVLCFLAPSDATKSDKSSQINPVDEGRFERIMIVLVASTLQLMEHFVINHVPTLGLLLVFLYPLEYDGDVINGCTIGGRELPVGVQ